MTRNLGSVLAKDAYEFLAIDNIVRKDIVIPLLTMDQESGYSRVCLLSPYQVVALGASQICFTVYSSHTKVNLDKSGRASLILPVSRGLHYVNGETRYVTNMETHDPESLYLMRIREVLEDYSELAPITSYMIFDESKIRQTYEASFSKLRDYLKTM